MPLPESYLALRRGLLLRLALSAALLVGIVFAGWSLVPGGGDAAKQASSAGPAASGAAQAPPTAATTPAAASASTAAGPVAEAMRGVAEPEPLLGKSLEVLTQRSVDAKEPPAEAMVKSTAEELSKTASSSPKLPKGPHLQAGIFASTANAEEMKKKLEAEGYPAYLETRVHVGPFPNRKDADKAREKLKAQGTATLFIAQ